MTDGPITILVKHLRAAGAEPAAIEAAVRELEAELSRDATVVEHATVAKSENATVVENSAPDATVGKPDGRMRDWADPQALAGKRDPMLLRFVFARDTRLSRSARAVGQAMSEGAFDPVSGRFAVAAATLARKAGCNRATVFRALNALENAGLIRRFSYAGVRHANAYQPVWDMFASVAKVLRDPVAPSQNATVKSEPAHQPSQNATQIQRDIYTPAPRGETVGRRAPPQQIFMLLPMSGGLNGKTHGDIATTKATERLWVAFNDLHKGRGETFLRSMPQAAWKAGVDAEVRNRGKGLAALLAALERDGLRPTGTGPP